MERLKARCRNRSRRCSQGHDRRLEPRARHDSFHDSRHDRHVPLSRARPRLLRRHGFPAGIRRRFSSRASKSSSDRSRGSRSCSKLLAVAEEVRVSPSSPLVDTRQSARVFSLRQDTIDLLPKGRDFTSLVKLAPGANEEPKLGGLSIDGSSASENRFVVNGIETTNLLSGVSGHGVLPEFVDEIQVKSSGYAAEYGGSTGGVINVVTKSGTNTWRGDVLVNFEGDALDGGRRPTLRKCPTDSTRAEDVTYPEDTYKRVEPGFAIGGPLKRDRAWLFAAYQPALIHTERTVTFTFDKSTATKASDQTANFFNINQTMQVHDNLRTRATLDWSPSRQDGMLPALDGATYPRGNFDTVDKHAELHGVRQCRLGGDPHLVRGSRAGYFTNNHLTENVIEQPLFVFRVPTSAIWTCPRRFSRWVGSRRICRTTSAGSIGCRASMRKPTRPTSGPWPGNTRSRQACSSTDAATTWTRA